MADEAVQPSPTSKLGINVRFYLIESDTGQRVEWDIGPDGEFLLEAEFPNFRGGDAKAFEATIRLSMKSAMKAAVHFWPTAVMYAIAYRDPSIIFRAAHMQADLSDEMDKKVEDEFNKLTKGMFPPKQSGQAPDWKSW